MFEPGLGAFEVNVRHLISILDFSVAEIESLLREADRFKKTPGRAASALKGKTIALIFEKPSTRTLVSFASGIQAMGGFPLVLQHDALQWKRGEPIADMARVMTRYVHGVMIRARHHADVQEFARHLTIPLINGLTDREHPCQVLADLQTLWERNGRKLANVRRLKIVFLGDSNNMSHSWLLLSGLLGLEFVLACPSGFDPDSLVMAETRKLALKSGGPHHRHSRPASGGAERGRFVYGRMDVDGPGSGRKNPQSRVQAVPAQSRLDD